MEYHFSDMVLCPFQFELRCGEALVAMEPKAFRLLLLLIENRERMVSKDEIVEAIWNDGIASDASIASCVRSVRAAVGDDGKNQSVIRTIHGQGFRFVADVRDQCVPTRPVANAAGDDGAGDGTTGNEAGASAPGTEPSAKPSLAVLPFQLIGPSGRDAVLGDALPHDLIQALSKLRWLSVIARGTTFRFRAPDPEIDKIAAALNVRYVLEGAIEARGDEMIVTLELSDNRGGEVIWAERIETSYDAIHALRADIVAKTVSALEVYIPLNEARGAQLGVSENLDAWSNYHLGLQHMYRFTKSDNARASAYFNAAVTLDPRFARAHAGLSFTSFQTAFLKYDGTPKTAELAARRFAERAVELDPLDPFANFTMGRSFWLQGESERSLQWLDRSLSLSPNYAQGHYSHAFSDMLACRASSALGSVGTALALSPLDPFLYGMLGVESLAHVIEEDFLQAANWGEKAAQAPGAHFLISMIAVIGHALNGDAKRAAYWARDVRARRPDARQTHFFQSFPFEDRAIRQRVAKALALHGF